MQIKIAVVSQSSVWIQRCFWEQRIKSWLDMIDVLILCITWLLPITSYKTTEIIGSGIEWVWHRPETQIFILLAVGPNYPFSGTWSKSREVPWTLRKIQIKPLLARHVCGKIGICQCHPLYLKPATACETGPWAILLD